LEEEEFFVFAIELKPALALTQLSTPMVLDRNSLSPGIHDIGFHQ